MKKPQVSHHRVRSLLRSTFEDPIVVKKFRFAACKTKEFSPAIEQPSHDKGVRAGVTLTHSLFERCEFCVQTKHITEY